MRDEDWGGSGQAWATAPMGARSATISTRPLATPMEENTRWAREGSDACTRPPHLCNVAMAERESEWLNFEFKLYPKLLELIDPMEVYRASLLPGRN